MMDILLSKLLTHSESGIVMKLDGDTLVVSGFRATVELEALRAELEASWLELAKQEAGIRIKNALAEAKESQRPPDFNDLTAKLLLGRIKPEEQQTLNAYYDALDALEREAAALTQEAEKAESVKDLNKITWPEWVGWEALPLRFELEASNGADRKDNPTAGAPDSAE